MKISKKDNKVEYEAAMKLIQDFNNKLEKQRELLQNQVTDSQRLEALESAVADLMLLSIKEDNQL
jgi:predicted  nucleic acid-binding Zn-ribbon protein